MEKSVFGDRCDRNNGFDNRAMHEYSLGSSDANVRTVGHSWPEIFSNTSYGPYRSTRRNLEVAWQRCLGSSTSMLFFLTREVN